MSDECIWRYTDIASLIHILREQKITLLDPQSWDDTNDSYFMSLYKKKKKLGTLLALCFSNDIETYHHWRVFAPGSGGVCIRFNKQQLLRTIKASESVRAKTVKYLTLRQLSTYEADVADLPFLKRAAFEHENEFRVVFESTKTLKAKGISINLTCIDRITLSPWMHTTLAKSVKQTLHAIPECEDLEIVRSTLVGNDEWKSYGDDVVT